MPERISDRMIRMSEYMPERMSEYTPYILPDGMSESMSEFIVCQGGDHSKKVIYAFFPPSKEQEFFQSFVRGCAWF